MKQGSNSRRSRGRGKGHGGQGRPQKIHNFDSNGPEGRVRGNAQQVYEKYLTMARDAMSAGDRIAMENYFQHAEHYLRVIMASDNGRGQLDAFKRRSQFGPFGTDEFGDEGQDGDGDGEQAQATQPQRTEQGGESREANRDNGNARKVPIEKSDERQPRQHPGNDEDDDGDDDEGLRRTLAV
jgi:hypothetical protein